MSFQQGLSGLSSSSKQLDTIGNNVANASTVGFKQSQAQFADMYAASLMGGGGLQTGTGAKTVAIAQQFTQGNITSTGNSLDLAINGAGFFQLMQPSGEIVYSRNGQFQLDNQGNIVNNQGHQLRGYQAVKGVVGAALGPITISSTELQPAATAAISVGANLDSREVVPVNAANFNLNDPKSYNSSTSLTVYDSLGAEHVASMYFVRRPITTVGTGDFAGASTTMTVGSTAGLSIGNTITLTDPADPANPLSSTTYKITSIVDGTTLTVSPPSAGAVTGFTATTNAGSLEWDNYLAVDGKLVPLPTGNPATAAPLARLTFGTDGNLMRVTANPAAGSVAGVSGVIQSPLIPMLNGSAQQINFDFNKLTEYGSKFGVTGLTQDGYAPGRLTGFNTSADGVIQGRYSNGKTQILGQLAIVNFTNPQGLQPMGGNEWVETVASGQPIPGKPGTGNLGVVQSSAIEESNVDLTAELVNMITAQRVYQANAQTIKTQDQILQTIVNLR